MLTIMLLALATTLAAQDSKTYTLYFDFNEHQLTSQATRELQSLLSFSQDLEDFTISIEAHTDDKGSASYNKRLARRRAAAVEAFLEKEGLIVNNSDVLNFGEDRPAYDNEGELGRQLNRRVDVTLTTIPLESLEDLMAKLRGDQRQHFTVDPNETTQLQAENGSTLLIPGGAFQFKDGSKPNGPIDIIIEEHYSKAGMLANELSTHSDGRMLETGGMIYIAAEADGRALDLREGQALTLGMTTDNALEGMQLFDAQTNGRGRPVGWTPTGQDFARSQEAALLIPPRPKIPIYVNWRVPFSRNWKKQPPKPAPVSVHRYREPQKPRLEDVRYNPPFLKRLFMGKKKIEAKKREIFDAQMARYQRNMENYKKRNMAYKKARKRYEEEMKAYRWAYDTWEGKLLEDSLELNRMQNKLEYEFRNRVTNKYKVRLAEWKAKKDSIMTAYYETQMANGELGMDGLSYYFYQIDKPGWINCDRFYDVPEEEKMTLAVRDSDPEEEKVFVVFKDINSMMRLYSRKGDRYVQNDVPKDAEVKIIGLKVQNGRPSMAVLNTRVGEKSVVELNYERCKINDIRKTLKSI